MAYDERIANEIRKLIENAPPGKSEYLLEHFDQEDVRDTVNRLRFEYDGDTLEEAFYYQDDTSPITINK